MVGMKSFLRILISAIPLLILPSLLLGQQLSERSIYERCYAKLARGTPQSNDPYVPQIEAGTLSGREACKNLLALGTFGAGDRISTFPGEPAKFALAKRVLASMTEFHYSWFGAKPSVMVNTCFDASTKAVIDNLEPAYFLSRALFDPQQNYDSVITGAAALRAIRTVDNPSRTIFSGNITKSMVQAGITELPKLTPNGELLGITLRSSDGPASARVTSAFTFSFLPNTTNRRATLANYPIHRNLGGGILGSQSYLLANWGVDNMDLFPNLEKMPRTWAKNVFDDLLCRSLPVVPASNTAAYVQTGGSALPFRGSTACLSCHTSMDQVAGVIRNLSFFRKPQSCNPNADPTVAGGFFMGIINPTLPKLATWGHAMDPDYRKRQPSGRFFFQPHDKSQLKNVEIESTEDLGQAIRSTEDFYICAAKRYYQYFTGIDVSLEPTTDADLDNPSKTPADIAFYRKQVISLGRRLKNTVFEKKPIKLIEAIIDSPEYGVKDFKLSEKAQ